MQLPENNKKQELQRTMKSRHLFMISLGGVIGSGLFLGSGYTIVIIVIIRFFCRRNCFRLAFIRCWVRWAGFRLQLRK